MDAAARRPEIALGLPSDEAARRLKVTFPFIFYSLTFGVKHNPYTA